MAQSLFSLCLALALAAGSAFVPSKTFAPRALRDPRAAPRVCMATATESKVISPLPSSVKPGVVTGQALRDLFAHAKENGYAMPGVNIVGASP